MIVSRVAVSVGADEARFPQKYEDAEVDGPPPAGLAARHVNLEARENPMSVLAEQLGGVDAVELGEDHAREGDFAVQRVRLVLDFGPHVESFFTAYVRAAGCMPCTNWSVRSMTAESHEARLTDGEPKNEDIAEERLLLVGLLAIRSLHLALWCWLASKAVLTISLAANTSPTSRLK